jgi:hypothetical protein
MEEVHNPFKKAGIVLAIVGAIDILIFVYCIINKINYSSSFNIFSLLAGIFLIKGGVKSAMVVRWFSTFFMVGFIGLLIFIPINTPLSLLVAQLHVQPMLTIGPYLFGIPLIYLLYWVYKQLSSPNSLQLLADDGYKTGKPKSAVFAGIGLVLILFVTLTLMLKGESGLKAKQLAQEQTGPGYQYHVTQMSLSGGKGSAVVTAYNNSEIKNVVVEW